MAEPTTPGWTTPGPPTPGASAPTRRVNVIGILMAVVFLTVASVGVAGNPWWLLGAGVKWIVTGAVALVGLGLLAGALPRRRLRR